MPSGGSSESSSSNSTSTTTQDNKVSATDNAIALGNEASFTYTDQFSPEVKDAFNELVGLARDAGLVAKEFASQAIKSNEASLDKVVETSQAAIDAANLRDQALLKAALPYLGVALIIWIFSFSKKGVKK